MAAGGKPNFFIVGSFKAGTTSLHRYLGAHPEIFMSEVKEPHYFVKHSAFRPQVVASEAAYLALFRNAGSAKVRGEASAYYFSMPESPALIHAFNPDAKILISLRHPVEVAYAFYYEQLFLGRERRAFQDALDDYAKLIEDWPNRLAAWREMFGDAQVKVVLLEDLARKPQKVFAEILAFLEVDTHFTPNFVVHNPAKALPPAWRARLQANLLVVAAVRVVFLFPALGAWVERLRSRRMAHAPRPPLAEDVRWALVARFMPVVERLETLLSRELPAWKA